MEGWLKLFREIENWEWYKDNNVKSVFFHLLIKACIKDVKYKGMVIKRGSLLTVIESKNNDKASLSNELGLTAKEVRTALKKLQKTGEIMIETTNKFTVITVVNFSKYQDSDYDKGQTKGEQRENKGQTKDEQRASIEEENKEEIEVKEVKENKKSVPDKPAVNFSPPSIDEVKNYCQERQNNVDADNFVNFYSSKGWYVGKNKMKDWKASVRTWERNVKKEGESNGGYKKHSDVNAENTKYPEDPERERLLQAARKRGEIGDTECDF